MELSIACNKSVTQNICPKLKYNPFLSLPVSTSHRTMKVSIQNLSPTVGLDAQRWRSNSLMRFQTFPKSKPAVPPNRQMIGNLSSAFATAEILSK
jgi:hypothetical protein